MLTFRLAIAAALLAAPAVAPSVALAAASDWHHVEGGAIRLVTDDAPDADGVLRGALEIRLKPGWKTYWRDPGSSGVPPSLTVTVGGEKAEVEIAFPAPTRFDDGYAVWAGYDRSVSLALTLRLPPGAGLPLSAPAVADAFLGVCETICIPVQAELTADEDAGEAEHAAAVDAAFAALPQPERPDFGVRPQAGGDGTITVEATLPAGVSAIDLFVAGTDTLVLGVPERLGGPSAPARFAVPVLYGSEAGPGENLAYTLVTSGGAVSGRLVLP